MPACTCTPETQRILSECPLHKRAEELLRLAERFVDAPHLSCWNPKLCGKPSVCPYCTAVHYVSRLIWEQKGKEA